MLVLVTYNNQDVDISIGNDHRQTVTGKTKNDNSNGKLNISEDDEVIGIQRNVFPANLTVPRVLGR
jgi:hypothetical protein